MSEHGVDGGSVRIVALGLELGGDLGGRRPAPQHDHVGAVGGEAAPRHVRALVHQHGQLPQPLTEHLELLARFPDLQVSVRSNASTHSLGCD